MNNFFSKIQNAARRTRLTAEEKQRMRVALYEAMKQAPRAAPAPSPVRIVKSPYVFLSPRFAGAFAVMLILALGSGTAYAAQGALPGSPLYPVKVNVNDAVRVALATTPQQKALANAAVAQERLEEAQALEAQGRLDATTTAQLQQNFDEHAALAIALAASSSPAATLAVEENASFAASTTAAPEGAAAGSSTAAAASSSVVRERGHFAARPFMKAAAATTTASSSQAGGSGTEGSTTPQESGAASNETVDNIPAFIARQRQMFDDIRQQVEDRTNRGGHSGRGNDRGNGGATSTQEGSSSSDHGGENVQLNVGL